MGQFFSPIRNLFKNVKSYLSLKNIFLTFCNLKLLLHHIEKKNYYTVSVKSEKSLCNETTKKQN